MKRYTPVLVAIAVASAFGLGWFLFDLVGSQRQGPSRSETAETAPGEARPSAPGSSGEAALVSATAVPVFQRLAINTNDDRPEACLVFSTALDASGETNYDDYLSIDPPVEHGLKVAGNSLCITGLAYAAEYRVTMLAGLPAANGKKSAYPETIPVALRDRPPAVSFSGGIILPRESGEGVPVSTVNVEQLEIRVLRVGDRLLSQLYNGLVDSTELYDYDTYTIEDQLGALVWEGTMDVTGEKNATVTTLVPIKQAIAQEKPGVYLLLASDAKDKNRVDYNWEPTAAQWVINTDIGLTSFLGADGLHVYARSLDSADPMANVEVALIARNNEELARLKTDASGQVHFNAELMKGKGGNEAILVMAYQGEEFSYLDLRRPAFDLTDRGVSGRAAPGALDAYLYTERGIYRPGETIYVTALVRDSQAKAIRNAPLTLIVRRPDGIEYRRLPLAADQAKDGGYAAAIPLSVSAPRGRWEVAAYADPEGEAVGRVRVDVQDFVPERLKITLSSSAKYLRPGDEAVIGVEARFLYGAPASDMAGEGQIRLQADDNPYPELSGYQFGRVEDAFSGTYGMLSLEPTDEEGRTEARGLIELPQPTTKALRAEIYVGLFEPGGRLTRQTLSIPVRTSELMLGIRPNFEDSWVKEGVAAGFEVVAVDADGGPRARDNIAYELVREVVNYQWYEVDGRWQWERQVRSLPVENGRLSIAADAPATYASTQEWGAYRFIVSDAETGASSSVRYWVGWGGSVGADRPDRVAVTLDKDTYMPGEAIKVDIRPPSAGQAMLVVASDKVFKTQQIAVPAEGALVTLTAEEGWGPGAYILVTHYRGVGTGNARAPVRSIGLAYLGLDRSKETLAVSMEVPEKVRPRSKFSLPVSVENASGPTYLTLAAVDEGILQLTDFESPAPAGYYYGKRRLGLDIRDDYGRLIEAQAGAMGELRSGGDGFGGGEGLTVVPTRTVALYSGIVTLDRSGRAVVDLQIPDYVGELRLMAVAYNASQLGSAEAALTVRDPVVADVTLPRFLAPGDKGSATLLVDNVEGAAGRYAVAISGAGALEGATSKFDFDLAAGERRIVSLPLVGGDPGIGTLSLSLKGPGDISFERHWPIEVRPGQRPYTQERVAKLAPGETLTLSQSVFEGLYPEKARLTVTLASDRAYDVPALLTWLDRYPYGCLEQTTSRAYPLLVYEELAPQLGIGAEEGLRPRIQDAVDRVLDMQTGTGNFGMWGWGGSSAYDWISVFALDFLIEAKARDYVVPIDAINRGTGWLRTSAAQSWSDDSVRAYAMYVLARQGGINLSDLRYFHDNSLSAMKVPMAAAHLGAALAEMGDRSRAYSAFQKALALASKPVVEADMPYYGSNLREVAGVTALAARAGQMDLLPALFERTMQLTTSIEATTTQEKAWMLLAADALAKAQGPLEVEVKGVASVGRGPIYLAALNPGNIEGVSVKNTGAREAWYSLAVEGVAIAPLPAETRGVTLRKSYYTEDGSTANLAALKQSDKVVVVIEGRMPDIRQRDMAVADLLPAGLEIETPLTPGAEGLYKFLPALTQTSTTEKRDDRFFAAFTIRGSTHPQRVGPPVEVIPDYAVAYLARATTPGSFTLPAATIEDMYAPGVKARSAVGEVVIVQQEP